MKLIESTPYSERPRERCLETGPCCLSLRECLALILGSGPAQVGCLGLAARILEVPGGGLSDFDEEQAFFATMESGGGSYLKSVSGLGPAGQAKLLAAFELGRRYALYRYSYHRLSSHVRSESGLAARALERVSVSQRIEPKEWLGFIPVYRTGEVGDLCIVERGVRTHVNVDPAELFARVLALRPYGFFLFHNHPSGNTTPSLEDRDLTEKVGELSKQLGVQLLGHWVVAPQTEQLLAPPYW